MAAATAVQKHGREELPHVQIRRGSQEDLPYFQGKEQRLHFAGAACEEILHVQGKRNPSEKVGAKTETTITDN